MDINENINEAAEKNEPAKNITSFGSIRISLPPRKKFFPGPTER